MSKQLLPENRPTLWHESNALIAACDEDYDLAQRYVQAMNDEGLGLLVAALESLLRLAKQERRERVFGTRHAEVSS